ncbi:hypothetical protein N658DRAFT_169998 [Parathielavia hyrcaniae]|uniref:Uncharacterized protein n=1 Tax=Parathielavia hyrcaniae TaxID=113614 RepID=A0AAN6PX28_9PEZI|nr:hypothetical protein N658DRAFT_169998 [Parathielavia hyrcaniae]
MGRRPGNQAVKRATGFRADVTVARCNRQDIHHLMWMRSRRNPSHAYCGPYQSLDGWPLPAQVLAEVEYRLGKPNSLGTLLRTTLKNQRLRQFVGLALILRIKLACIWRSIERAAKPKEIRERARIAEVAKAVNRGRRHSPARVDTHNCLVVLGQEPSISEPHRIQQR